MPSRSSRRLRKAAPEEEGDGSGGGDASGAIGPSHEPSRPIDPAADAGDASSGLAVLAAGADDAADGQDAQLPASASAGEEAGSKASADPALAFEPPAGASEERPSSPERSIQVQLRPPSSAPEPDEGTSGPIPPIEEDAKPKAVEAAVKQEESTDAAGEEAGPVHRAAFAPPVVTKTTRRETFGAAVPVLRKKKHEGKSLLQASSGSSEEDPMMDLFSPPPTSLRTRPRPRHPDVDLSHAVTASASLEEHPESHAAGRPGLERARPLESASFEAPGPPTIYTPHTAEGEPMALSTTQKGRYQGRVVHVPRKTGESHDEGEVEAEGEARQRRQQSAPARMPAASRHPAAAAMASDHAGDGGPSDDFPPMDYDSNEDIHAALQLTFEDSPDTSPRDGQHRKAGEGMPSPSKRARTPSREQHPSHDPQPPGYPGYHPSSYYPYPPGGQQQQQPPGYPSYSSPHRAPGYQPPPPSQQQSPGYPPQWPPQGPQPPGYYAYPAQGGPPGYQQPLPHYPDEPSPVGSRTSASKRRSPKRAADTTMETAEMSYETAGPMSPPSSKKKRDGTTLQSMGTWASPPRETVRGLETDATPQRGSTFASRRRSHNASSTPHSMSYSVHELHPTPSMGASATEIFPAESWSPSHMQAFASFDDGETPAPPDPRRESGSSVNVSGDSGNSNMISCSSGPHYEGSPVEGRPAFTSVLSPTAGGITIRGSPISRRDDRADDHAGGEAPRESVLQSLLRDQSTTPGRGGESDAAATSPPRRAWQTSSTNTGMRIKIGQVGMETTEARRGIEGINSVLRGSPVSAPPRTPHAPPPGLQYQYPSDSAGGYAPTPNQRGAPPAAYKTPQPPVMMTPVASKAPSAAALAARLGTGKENADNAEPSLPPPCNCKKSKCLKLYCDCFSAERYCSGCKCTNCQNTPAYEAIRQKAVADTKAKNPNAFKVKLNQTTHAMGCRCKKSGCLKKYCECFSGGIVCGAKCKCANCKNFVGSQALIDRRRKIKDHKGAEAAMQSAEKVWKGSMSDTKVVMRSSGLAFAKSPIVHDPTRAPGGPYSGGVIMSPVGYGAPGMMQQSPGYPHPGMMQQSPMVYGSMAAPQQPNSASRAEGPKAPARRKSAPPQRPLPPGYPVRGAYQPRAIRRKLPPPQKFEPTAAYFGHRLPPQTKATAEKIMAYLSNDELFCAAVVSKTFSSAVADVINARR